MSDGNIASRRGCCT